MKYVLKGKLVLKIKKVVEISEIIKVSLDNFIPTGRNGGKER